jgi:hypothetical protein
MGKASHRKTSNKRVKADEGLIEDLFALRNARSIPPTISLPPRGTNVPGVEHFLKKIGDTMTGPLAFRPEPTAIDSDGHLDLSPTSGSGTDKDTSYVLMSGTNPDILNFIDGAQFNGQYLIVQGTPGTVLTARHAVLPSISNIVGDGVTQIITVTTSTDHGLTTGDKINILSSTGTVFAVQNASVTVSTATIFTYDLGSVGSATPETSGLVQDGNIVTGDGTDVVLDGTVATNGVPVAIFIFDVTVQGFGAWRFIGGAGVSGGGAGGGVQDPIITKDNGDITSAGPGETLDWAAVGGNFHRYTATGDIVFTMSNLPTTGKYEQVVLQIKQDATGGRLITFADSFENAHTPVVALGANAVTTLVFYSYFDGADQILGFNTNQLTSLTMAMSDENTPLDVASGSVPFTTFRMPYGMTVVEVRTSLTTAGSGSKVTVDIEESGSSILSTAITIDVGERTSTTASVPAVISDPLLSDDAEIGLFLTARDSGNVATGLKCTLVGYIT